MEVTAKSLWPSWSTLFGQYFETFLEYKQYFLAQKTNNSNLISVTGWLIQFQRFPTKIFFLSLRISPSSNKRFDFSLTARFCMQSSQWHMLVVWWLIERGREHCWYWMPMPNQTLVTWFSFGRGTDMHRNIKHRILPEKTMFIILLVGETFTPRYYLL